MSKFIRNAKRNTRELLGDAPKAKVNRDVIERKFKICYLQAMGECTTELILKHIDNPYTDVNELYAEIQLLHQKIMRDLRGLTRNMRVKSIDANDYINSFDRIVIQEKWSNELGITVENLPGLEGIVNFEWYRSRYQ